MNEKIDSIKESIKSDLDKANNLQDIVDIKARYVGKQGLITEMTKNMKDYSIEERKEIGKVTNELKNLANDMISSKENSIKEALLNEKLNKESVDISLPATSIPMGAPNILESVIEEFEEVFMSMGYDVVDGPEIEQDKYNFELLNLPKGHPARDAQDTFYIKDDELLLRSQTSPVQVREMLKYKGTKPIRIVCPGKTYRRDDDDATHSHQFMQFEGLLVDKNISLTDLKGTFDIIAKKAFGEECQTR